MPIWDGVNTTATIINPITIPYINCQVNFSSAIPNLLHAFFSVYLVLGWYYVIYGYRYFRSSMFATGFSFAAFIVYPLCTSGDIMPEIYSKLVSAGAGLLFGLITMLIQFVGLFISGLHVGVLKGATVLALYSHIFATNMPTPYWTSILVCLAFGITTASMNVIWKKGLTIVSTSVYGAVLVAMSLDHFLEDWAMVKWIYKRVMLEPVEEQPCTLSWIIVAVVPVTAIFGIFVQTFWTGTGIHHEQGFAAKPRRLKAVPLTREQKADLRQRKYRYLYQVRTAHGDVISQSYVQALQQKKNISEPWSTCGIAECSTLQSDSTHLTVLATDMVTQDSDTDEIHPIGACH